VYKILDGKFEGKRAFGRPRRRWEDKHDFVFIAHLLQFSHCYGSEGVTLYVSGVGSYLSMPTFLLRGTIDVHKRGSGDRILSAQTLHLV